MNTTETDSNYKLISDYKWKDGYSCRNCGNDRYFNGKAPHSRRCSKCKKDESATAGTIFNRLRIPIDAAIYIIQLILQREKKLSSDKMKSALHEQGYEVDLKTLSDFRTKVLARVPVRTMPYYIDEVILLQLVYLQQDYFHFYGLTNDGYRFSCALEKGKSKLKSVVDTYVNKDARLSVFSIDKTHGKFRPRLKETKNLREPFTDHISEELILERDKMLAFCFGSTGNTTIRDYFINLYFFLKDGGDLDTLMKLLVK